MHQEPTATEILEAVREHLREEVVPATTGSVQYHARVSANLLAIVVRELTAGGAPQERAAVVRSQLGAESDAELSRRIRDGELAIGPDVLAALRSVAEAELAVDNPRYLRRTVG